jgi:hypothetical protein
MMKLFAALRESVVGTLNDATLFGPRLRHGC